MSKRLITVGHSPDPDDAFMFYALAHDKLDTGDLQFRHELQDIETLNRRALRGESRVRLPPAAPRGLAACEVQRRRGWLNAQLTAPALRER